MTDDLPVDVLDEELLARMVFAKRHFRPSNNTAKLEAFLPPPNLQLSVIRHYGLREEEIWKYGADVATGRGETLYGRADIEAHIVRTKSLQVAPDPPPRNHAIVTEWPLEKDAKMSIAQELAVSAHFLRKP